MNELIEQSPQSLSITSAVDIIFNDQRMKAVQAIAESMAAGTVMVPKHLQQKPSDCFAVALQAMAWGMSPFAVAQKTHLVNGVLGYESQLVNAVIQASGAINGRFHYEYSGEGNSLSCRVGAIPRGENAIVWSEWLNSQTVAVKNSPLWKTNPRQQLGYLQVKNWARAYCPGAILGVYTTDELSAPIEIEINPSPQSTPAPPSKPALEQLPDDVFNDKLQKQWLPLIDSGKKSSSELINALSTKYVFTSEQLAAFEPVVTETDNWSDDND